MQTRRSFISDWNGNGTVTTWNRKCNKLSCVLYRPHNNNIIVSANSDIQCCILHNARRVYQDTHTPVLLNWLVCRHFLDCHCCRYWCCGSGLDFWPLATEQGRTLLDSQEKGCSCINYWELKLREISNNFTKQTQKSIHKNEIILCNKVLGMSSDNKAITQPRRHKSSNKDISKTTGAMRNPINGMN